MPLRKRYPLEVLVRHREDAVQERALELGRSRRVHSDAIADRDQKREALQDHLEQTKASSTEEIERTLEGSSQVEDLARLFAWQVGRKIAAEEMGAQVRSSETRVQKTGEEVEAGREKLLESHKEAEVIHRHREGFEKHHRKLDEQFEEEEANETSYTRQMKG